MTGVHNPIRKAEGLPWARPEQAQKEEWVLARLEVGELPAILEGS